MPKIDVLKADITKLENAHDEYMAALENAEGDDLVELNTKLADNTEQLRNAKDAHDAIVNAQTVRVREMQSVPDMPAANATGESGLVTARSMGDIVSNAVVETGEKNFVDGLRALNGHSFDIPAEIVMNELTGRWMEQNTITTADVTTPATLTSGIPVGMASSYFVNHLTPRMSNGRAEQWNESLATVADGFDAAEGAAGVVFEPDPEDRTVVPAEFDIQSKVSSFELAQRPDIRAYVRDNLSKSFLHHASLEAGAGGSNLATRVGAANVAFTGNSLVRETYLIATNDGNTENKRAANFASAVVSAGTTLSTQSGGPVRGLIARQAYNRMSAARESGLRVYVNDVTKAMNIPGADHITWTPIDVGFAAEAQNIITAVLMAPDAGAEEIMSGVSMVVSTERFIDTREIFFSIRGYRAPKFRNRWAYAQIQAKTTTA